MYARNIEPTTNDLIGAYQAEDISRYGNATQERIIDHSQHGAPATRYPSADAVYARSLALAQSVRDAEQRAAVKYAQTLRCTAHGNTACLYCAEARCGASGCAHSFDDHSVNNSGCGCGICYPASLAPSGTD